MAALLSAALHGSGGAVGALLRGKADVNRADWIALANLLQAAAAGHVEVVRQLLTANAEVHRTDCIDGTPLLQAASDDVRPRTRVPFVRCLANPRNPCL